MEMTLDELLEILHYWFKRIDLQKLEGYEQEIFKRDMERINRMKDPKDREGK